MTHAGGYFFGCVPDGKAVMQTLQPSFPSYKGPLLQILAEWKGSPQPFGSAYSMAIGDTVTQGIGMMQSCQNLQGLQVLRASPHLINTRASARCKAMLGMLGDVHEACLSAEAAGVCAHHRLVCLPFACCPGAEVCAHAAHMAVNTHTHHRLSNVRLL